MLVSRLAYTPCAPPLCTAPAASFSLSSATSTESGMSLVDLDFGNKVPAGAASAVAAAAAARNYVVKPRLGV